MLPPSVTCICCSLAFILRQIPNNLCRGFCVTGSMEALMKQMGDMKGAGAGGMGGPDSDDEDSDDDDLPDLEES